MSQRELEIIEQGRAVGWSDDECLTAVKQNRLNVENARLQVIREEEQAELMAELIAEKQIATDTKKKVYTDKSMPGTDYFLEDGNWVFYDDNNNQLSAIGDVRERLSKKYEDKTVDITDYDKIIAPNATWTDHKGKDKKLDDNILDYRDDDFVANTLTREYGEDFEFVDSGSDMITVTSKKTGLTHEFETNVFWDGSEDDAEIKSGKGLIKWMKGQKFGDMSEKGDADYRAIENEDGDLEWHYVDEFGDDVGVVESTSALQDLNGKYPEALNESKKRFDGVNDFKVVDGEWYIRNEDQEWERASGDIALEMISIHGDPDLKEEDGVIYNHGLVPLKAVKAKEALVSEHDKRQAMGIDEFYETVWMPKNYTNGPSWKNVVNSLTHLTDGKEGNMFSRDFGKTQVIEEEYNKYIRQSKTALDNHNEITKASKNSKGAYNWYLKDSDEQAEKSFDQETLLKLETAYLGNEVPMQPWVEDGEYVEIQGTKDDIWIHTDENGKSYTYGDFDYKTNVSNAVAKGKKLKVLQTLYETSTEEDKEERFRDMMLETQPEWTKFYDEEDIDGWEDLDINDFNDFVKNHPSFKHLDLTTYGATEDSRIYSGDYGAAGLKWDEDKKKHYWSGGAGEGSVHTIDKLKAQVLTEYLQTGIGKNMEIYDTYEQAGTFDNLNLLDEYASNVSKLDAELTPITEEYEKLKKGIDDGTIKSSKSNMDKLNNLGVKINGISEVINFNVDNYNGIANDEANMVLFDGYRDLTKKNAALSKSFGKLIDPKSTNAINAIASKEYNERLDEQERLLKAENGHIGWQLASMGEGLWSSLVGGVTGIAGLAEAYVPELWSDTSGKEKAQVMSTYSNIAEQMTWNAVADGNMIDPETGDLNWSAIPSQVAPVVLDMYLMTQTGGALGAVKTGAFELGKKGAKYTAKALSLTGKSTKFMEKVAPIGRRLNKISTAKNLKQMGNQFTGGMMIILPKNIEEAVMQVDEDFSYEDALQSAFNKTITESAIEMINPDVKFLKGIQKFKAGSKYGDLRLWNPKVKGFKNNAYRMLNIFGQNLKNVPSELLEENLQELTNGVWNGYYNQTKGTDFHMPTAEDYKALSVLTPLSVLTGGFIRTRGFRKGGVSSGMYQAAVENYEEFNAEMLAAHEGGKLDYVDDAGNTVSSYPEIMEQVNQYVTAKANIPYEEYSQMSNSQRQETLSLLVQKAQLESKIQNYDEVSDPDSSSKDHGGMTAGEGLNQLEKDLKNVEGRLKKVANSVQTEFMGLEEQRTDIELMKLKAQWKGEKLGSQKKADLTKKIRELTKSRNELRDKGHLYEFNGKGYNNVTEFIEAVKNAKKNGYFSGGHSRSKIRISNKVDSAKAEYIGNMVNKLTGSQTYKGGELLMNTNDATEAEGFTHQQENRGKTLEDYKEELKQELLKNPEQQDVDVLNNLRNVKKYLELRDRGYAHNPDFGGMVMFGSDDVDLRVVDEISLTEKIKAISEVTGEAGIMTVPMTQEQIADNYLDPNGAIDNPDAIRSNAFMMPILNEKTGKMEPALIINTTQALKNKALTAPTHELLHAALFAVINGPIRVIEKDGIEYETHLTKKGAKLIQGFIKLLPKAHLDLLNADLESRGYFNKNEDGDIVEPFETYAEEYLAHYHDLVVNSKKISLSAPDTRGTFEKIADYFVSFWKQETEEELHGVMDGKLDTPEKLLQFMRGFNQQALNNKFTDQVKSMVAASKGHYGKVVKKEDDTVVESRGLEDTAEDYAESKTDLFTKSNNELDSILRDNFDISNFSSMNEEDQTSAWNSLSDTDKLVIGYSLGQTWRPFASSKLRATYEGVPGYHRFKEGILDLLTTGIEVGNNGLPYLVKTWDPSKGRKLTSHIFGELPKRIPHVISLPQFAGFGELMVRDSETGGEFDFSKISSEDVADSILNSYDTDEALEVVKEKVKKGHITEEQGVFITEKINGIKNDNVRNEFETGKVRKILGIKSPQEIQNEINKASKETDIANLEKQLKEAYLYEKVLSTVLAEVDINTLKSELADVKSQKQFRKRIEKGFVKELRNEVKRIIGTQNSTQFKEFLKNNKSKLIDLLAIKYKNRFPTLTKDGGRMGTGKSLESQTSEKGSFVTDEKGGNRLWLLESFTPKQFEDLFIKGVDGKGRDTQYKSLVNALANELGLDAVFQAIGENNTNTYGTQLTEAIKRNPTTMFSRGSDMDAADTRLIEDAMAKESLEMDWEKLRDMSLIKGFTWGTTKWRNAVRDAGIHEGTIKLMEVMGIDIRFKEDDIGGFKTPFNNWVSKNIEKLNNTSSIVDLYNQTINNSEEGRKQYTKAMFKLVDTLPPKLVKVLGARYFGLNGKTDRGLIEKNRYDELDRKIKEKSEQEDNFEYPFDINAVGIVNSGQGIAKSIRDIQFLIASVVEKKALMEERGLNKKISALNANNPLALKFINNEIIKILASESVDAETKAGIIRYHESATSNVNAQRGLTTIKSIQWYGVSQAPYVGVATKSFKLNRTNYMKGDLVGIPSNTKSNTKNLENVKLNESHPDYGVAEEFALEYVSKQATIIFTTKGGTKSIKKARKKIETGDTSLDNYLSDLMESRIAGHLRIKGEHAKPSANAQRETLQAQLLAINKILSKPNTTEKTLKEFNNKYNSIMAEYTQTLGAEINSFVQDQELGPTSTANIDRMIVLEKIEGLDLNSFHGVDLNNRDLQGRGLVNRLVSESVGINKLIEKLNLPSDKQVSMAEKIRKATMFSRATNESRGISVWDFDDTLARTKSGVRYKMPNPTGIVQPGRKVIFLAGGAGSGKSNVVNKLGLEKDGFKIVNQDISLEWLKKNHGLPEDMNDLTSEQLSQLGKLQHQARGIAKAKMMKYQGNGSGVIIDGTGGSLKVMTKLVQEFRDKGYDVQMVFVNTSEEVAVDRNAKRKERTLREGIVRRNHAAVQANIPGFKELFGENFTEINTDFLGMEDAMPSENVKDINRFTKGYINGRLDAGEFADKGADLVDQGAEFDFSEFNVVVGGEQGPFFKKAMDRVNKFGTEHQYVLTARPAASAPHIKEFLESQGLNIPLENITGLENSTAEAKALWILEKVSEGYNDFYFADDAMQNVDAVRNVLEQVDVKYKVQQAKYKFSKATSVESMKDVDRLTGDNVYSSIKFSRAHRAEYEKTISKSRPDLVKDKLVPKTVDNMFDFIDNLDVAADKKRKYEKITTKWLATSNVKLGEDGYKIQQAVEIAEKHKEDVFSYRNPNELIEKYAGKTKAKPLDPNKVKEFTPLGVFSEKHGVTIYEVEDTKEGQQAVRDVINSHWGENSNPWCLTKAKEGKLTDDAWMDWIGYSDSKKHIVFQNGRLSSFYANSLYWDRMDNDTKSPVVRVKEGKVTKVVELRKKERVKEVITISEDGNTTTTEYKTETNEYNKGTKVIEERSGGKKVKTKRVHRNGTVEELVLFGKDGKPTAVLNYDFLGGLVGVNRNTRIFEEETSEDVALKHGDVLSIENFDYDTRMYNFSATINLAAHGIKTANGATTTIIGWKMSEKAHDAMKNLVKKVDGKVRADINKILEVDPDAKGIPSERGYTPVNTMFSKPVSKEFNDILESTTGTTSEHNFSDAQAKIRGKKANKFKLWIPPSAEDFKGLVYQFLGKGKVGEAQLEFFDEKLFRPFAKATNEINTTKQSAVNDYVSLIKGFPGIKKSLRQDAGRNFTIDQAVRVYIWNKLGHEIPGLSKGDLKYLIGLVESMAEVKAFADSLSTVSRRKNVGPSEYWMVETIQSDILDDGYLGDARKEYLSEFAENREQIFGKWVNGNLVGPNMNKIEAIYGSEFRDALEDILHRMEFGRNRHQGRNKIVNAFNTWANNSVGSIMFLNMRSAILQTISAVNYLNWSDNNPLKAAAAFANQPQFWRDFSMIFNSDMLKQRRAGHNRGVNETELAAAVAGQENKVKAALAWLLKKGFLPTQIADSFAIASGGASFFRNRVNTYLKQGMTQEQAETKAWTDFQEITEESQQSSRADLISQQQASPLGHYILAFKNTPMQYGRLMKKAFLDLKNGRGDVKSNVGKILYYGMIQNFIFAALQQALFAAMGDDDEDEMDDKKEKILNSMLDSILYGFGISGTAVSVVKNSILEYIKQEGRGWNADHTYTILRLLSFSPTVGSKFRKVYSAIQTRKFNEDIMDKMSMYDINHPTWSIIGNLVEGTTNIPLGRMIQKTTNIQQALDSRNEAWQRVALLLGWNTWDFGIKDQDILDLKEVVKEDKKIESKEKSKKKKEEKKKEQEKENEVIIKENKKKSKKDGICSAISKGNKRCKTKVVEGKFLCTVHEKVTQNKSGKEVRCKGKRTNGDRCNMKTKAKSKLCYYHD